MLTSDIPVIELSGSPRERGRQYGKAAKPLIAQVVAFWRRNLGGFTSGDESLSTENTDRYLKDFFQKTNFIPSIKQWAPDLLEEVEGIAEGSEQDFRHILGLQLMDEEWVFGLSQKLDRPTTKCTAFGLALKEGGVSFAGQNMDVPSWIEGTQVLLRVLAKDSSPEILVFAFAGSIGVNGFNANAIGVTCNTLVQLEHSTTGLPVSFITRLMLEKNSIEDAEAVLTSVDHASGQNYILASPGNIKCFECCASSKSQYDPADSNGRIFHTNHPLVNTDQNSAKLVRSSMENTQARFDSISSRLGGDVPITLNNIKAALSAHDDENNPVSRKLIPENTGCSIGYTAGSSIYECSENPRLHLASGPPCETEYRIFEFTH